MPGGQNVSRIRSEVDLDLAAYDCCRYAHPVRFRCGHRGELGMRYRQLCYGCVIERDSGKWRALVKRFGQGVQA